MRKTQHEIDSEIKRLRKLRKSIPQFSAFNDDNHAAIDAQITVLQRTDIDEDDIYSEFDTHMEQSHALEVLDWKRGEEIDGGNPRPTRGKN